MNRPRIARALRIAFSAICGIAMVLIIVLWVVNRGRNPSVSIPLSAILSTSGQGELQGTFDGYRMVDGKKEFVVPTGEAIQHFFETTKGSGPSNIFLVDAPNDISAIGVSSMVFAAHWSADFPVTLNEPNPPRGNHWLVVFIGVGGSEPVRWSVDSVSVGKGIIRFNYHKNKIGESTCDIHYYYYWVPVGRLDDGVYDLELYDTSLKAITLLRRVEVQSPRPTKRR
jgi:hypothetical protein